MNSRHGRIRVLAVALVGLSLVSLALGLGIRDAYAQDTSVSIVDFAFEPAALTVSAGSTVTPIFANPAGARFIVSYNAECAVAAAAGNSSTWMDVDVRAVNIATGAVFTLTPTAGGLDAFCTSNGTAANDGWQRVVVNAIGGPGMPAGNYRVNVRARLSGAGTGHLGDTSLVISR